MLEQALTQAIRGCLALPPSQRVGFIIAHLDAQASSSPTPSPGAETLFSLDERLQELGSRAAELAQLAEVLTTVVNAARGQPGWPLAAVAAGLRAKTGSSSEALFNAGGGGGGDPAAAPAPPADPQAAAKAKWRQENAEKRQALEKALAIAQEAQDGLAAAGPLATLSITRDAEAKWGDREMAFMARCLERPAFDEDLLRMLQARQRLFDATEAKELPEALEGKLKELDKALKVLGVSIDQYGMWREEEEDEDGVSEQTRIGVMGSCLLVNMPEEVTALTIGALEVRGGVYVDEAANAPPRGLGSLLTLMPSLTSLSLFMCQFLASLPEEIGVLTSLTSLNLGGCKRLPSLPEAAFGRLTSLRDLDLSDCENLRAIPPTVGLLTKLCSLVVSQSYREYEEEEGDGKEGKEGGAKKDKGGAKKKDDKSRPNGRGRAAAAIDSPGITALPEELCALTSLRHLSLGLPMMSKLPDGFGQLNGLKTLSLSGSTSLTSLPESMGGLASLVYLELPDAPATHTLPDGLWAGMESLRTLDLYQCASLAQVPASLSSRAPTLETLYIGSLELKELPPSLSELTSLKHLELTTPSLAALPDNLGGLTALASLHVTHAAIEALPASIGQLAQLSALKLSRCATLGALPDALCECSSLQYVELSECPSLKGLPSGFGGIASLMALDFPGCEDLADVLYDDPVVDVLEAAGVGVFGPGIEIETRKYNEVKERLASEDEERKGRLIALRAAGVDD